MARSVYTLRNGGYSTKPFFESISTLEAKPASLADAVVLATLGAMGQTQGWPWRFASPP